MWMDNWILNKPVELWPTFANERGERCPFLFRCFESRATVVVLSRSNKPEVEVHTEVCKELGIPVLQRRGGGGTVLLGPGCVILSFAFFGRSSFDNDIYFRAVNQIWADSIRTVCGIELTQNGISDLTWNDRKVAGTSLFRRKRLVVYQGSLLVDPHMDLITKCLKHPSREPDYRKNRDHNDFLTSLSSAGCRYSASELAAAMTPLIAQQVSHQLSPHAAPGWEERTHL